MDKKAFQAVHFVEFYRKLVAHGVRPDARGFSQNRRTIISKGSITSSDGSGLVKIGDTAVVAAIKCEVGKHPKSWSPSSKQNPFLIVNLELRPICSAKFKPSHPPEEAQRTATMLNTLMTEVPFFDRSVLHVHEEYYWYLYVDLYCLNHAGNITDASLLALIAALQNLRLPQVEVEFEAVKGIKQVKQVNIKEGTTPRRIHFDFVPLAQTFCLFENNTIMVDPTADEEDKLADTNSILTIIYTNTDKLCSIEKYGGSFSLSATQLQACIQQCKTRSNTLLKLLGFEPIKEPATEPVTEPVKGS
eukprot:TRINITY_DN11256_c0_g1_i1.p1 TRINITY_DN11256_c0_g1~~TRINITY_DN11256_c0_g1_i1.p1  ORF type:complete len:303 (-),score=44.07 TRINITY_DN11256_c0_g1_i1:4-912(-)